LASPLETSIDK